MTFAALDQPAVRPLVERVATAERITVLIGAGASMEAFLPSWSELIARLLARVAEKDGRLPTEKARADWIARTIERDDLLGAAAVVEVMSGEDLPQILPDALYGAGGAGSYEPGPIAREVARLRDVAGQQMSILTTNYDDLIERALQARGLPKARIKSYVRRRNEPPAGSVPVTHLHGFAGRGRAPTQLVLTEEQYHQMQRRTSWQEQLVTERLENSLCLFVGTSLTDPNLIRYLYGYRQSAARGHAAVFVRQGGLADLTPEVREVREDAVARRWARCGVEALFVDHYADAAQLIYEIGHRRTARHYEPVGTRAAEWLRGVEKRVLRLDNADAFRAQQIRLSTILRLVLDRFLEAALAGSARPADEQIAIAIWLLSRDGRELTGWAHSDRAHQDPATIAGVPVSAHSDWVAVRALCQGVRYERDRDNYASRWHFVRGLPLVLEHPTRLPVGTLTIASTKPGHDSILNAISPERRGALHSGLTDAAITLMEVLLEDDTLTP